MSLLNKLFDQNQKFINKNSSIVKKINELEVLIKAYSDEELKNKTKELKQLIVEGKKTTKDILPEAFAIAREASIRTLNQRHFDVQLFGGIALSENKIAEMKTGEGKTLTAVLANYLNALNGKGVHVITVNDYLAKRDAVWMGQVYYALGFSIGCISQEGAFIYDPSYTKEVINKDSGHIDKERDETASFKVFSEFLRPAERKEAYQCDITYGTSSEFGFDYLRDNLAQSAKDVVQHGHHYATIDEIDSILIDEARTPLIISQPDMESSSLYKQFALIAPRLIPEEDFKIDYKNKAISLLEPGLDKLENIIGFNIYDQKGVHFVHHLEEALKAQFLFQRDKDYIVKGGQVLIVDEFTGRVMPDRRYSGGLHQALEAKEGIYVNPESKTVATVTIQNYFRMYENICGMTGTAATSAEELASVYKLEVVSIPTNKPNVRKDLSDKIYRTEAGKYKAIINEVKERNLTGQPILIGTRSVEINEKISKLLSIEGIKHNVLNAKQHEREGEIIAQAGKLGAVTVATNMAGRGVDIILGGNPSIEEERNKILELGGLFVLGTERHEARRIDNQLRGRAGRQGDQGTTQFFVSLEDELVKIFAPKTIGTIMEKFGFKEEEAISHPMISKSIESAQSKIEGINFDIRKHVLEYDDVLNQQRKSVYNKRQVLILENDEQKIKELALNLIEEKIKNDLKNIDLRMNSVLEYLKNLNILMEETIIKQNIQNQDKLFYAIFENIRQSYFQKENDIENFNQITRAVVLNILDSLWMVHLEKMEQLRDSVSLKAYSNIEPLVAYKKDSYVFYKDLWNDLSNYVLDFVLRFQKENVKTETTNKVVIAGSKDKIGRNDPCPCGSGKKYKHCCGK